MSKNHKNIFITLGSYVIALIITLTGIPFSGLINSPKTYNLAVAGLVGIVLIIGVIFSLKSNKIKESSWVGSLLGIVGILWFIFTFLVLYLSSVQ